MAIVWAVLTRIGVVSVERDDVGNGHMHNNEIDCTMCQVCGGFEIISQRSDFRGAVKAVAKLGSSAY